MQRLNRPLLLEPGFRKISNRWLGLVSAVSLWLAPALMSAPANPFEEEIRTFEVADRLQPPPQRAILFTGSSTIRLWTNLVASFPGKRVFGRGFGGSQMSDLNRYMDRIVIPYHPKHILVYEGDNDLASGKSPEQILVDYQEFATHVRGALPKVRLSFLTIKPSRARWQLLEKIRTTNRLISEFSKSQKRMDVIDVFSATLNAKGEVREELLREDGLHLNAQGYQVWTEVIRKKL